MSLGWADFFKHNLWAKLLLLDASVGIFESGSANRREREQEQLVEHLYREIGQLKAEVDWLRKKGSTSVCSGNKKIGEGSRGRTTVEA